MLRKDVGAFSAVAQVRWKKKKTKQKSASSNGWLTPETEQEVYVRSKKRRSERTDSLDIGTIADREMHLQRMSMSALMPNKATVEHIRLQKHGRVKGWHAQKGRKDRLDDIAQRHTGRVSLLGKSGVGMHTDWARMNREELPEVAILGHSNCGKSSLLNALCGTKPRSGPAAVSSRAGWTAELSFFRAKFGMAWDGQKHLEQLVIQQRRQKAMAAEVLGELIEEDDDDKVGTLLSPSAALSPVTSEAEELRQVKLVRDELRRNTPGVILVDTPGYGFTVGDQRQLTLWGELIADYLNHSKQLVHPRTP